jgi:hypothetical protein
MGQADLGIPPVLKHPVRCGPSGRGRTP